MTFCVNGARFEPEQYYRDDDQARDILWKCRENPVLVTGLRRIGKSWFLRRFAQIFQAGATRHFAEDGAPSERPLEPGMPAGVTLLDAGSEDFEQQLRAFLARKDRSQVLAIDELEKLAGDPARIHLLDPILSYRPLLLAAAPCIHELAHRFAPSLAEFFERGCVSAVLGPLRAAERRALMLQTCDPGQGVLQTSTGMALWRDWGGHPLVLQQVGELAKRDPKLRYGALVNLVHAALNGAPRYGYSLCETGLTSAQREVLIKIAAGAAPPGENPAAAQLHAHGAVIPSKRKIWAIENVVLQRYFEALTALLASPPPPESERTPPPEPPPPPPRRTPVRVFSWIHLSDLHFGAGSVRHRFDQKSVMRAIVRDVRENAPRGVDRIFITGDIAFSAQHREYDEARAAMNKITEAAGVGRECLRFVPGNHDVDRAAAKKPLVRSAHQAVRAEGVELDDLLGDPEARIVLLAKLGAYQAFVSGFSRHPSASDGAVDWFELVDVPGGHGKLRIVGLSTVWVSDENDRQPNLALALGPIEQACEETSPGEMMFVLTHHPQEWIHAGSARLLDNALAQVPHIHFCGHVHEARAGTTKRFGSKGRGIRYVAGAAHGDPSEESRHGVAWGALRYDPAAESWQAGWAPRTYVADLGKMRPDRTRYPELDDEGFAWEDLDCPWPAPAG